jgi:hypothetical protein
MVLVSEYGAGEYATVVRPALPAYKTRQPVEKVLVEFLENP